MKDKRIALIGCGPSGMAVLAAFDEAKQNGQSVPQIVCFEKQSNATGLWNLSWRTGLDENGEPVHGSMYKYLWSNGPKECLEMANHKFDDHFKKPIPSFPPRAVLRDYLVGRFDKINEKDVRYNTVVRNVTEFGDLFQVTFEDLKSKKQSVEVFDYVIVATGHYSIPHVPAYRGIESFPGRIIHSHDFRNAEEFKNQIVLLVGASYSAEDIASQCYKYGAKKCIVSCRSKLMNFKWPNEVIELPGISHFEGSSCHFVDKSSHEIDAIIFCTGYNHHFPFMENKLKLEVQSNSYYPDHLYKGVFLQHNTKIMYMAMQNQAYTYTLFDNQAWYIRDVVLGKIAIPDVIIMENDIKKWLEKCKAIASVQDVIHFQKEYLNDLCKETNYCTEEVNEKMATMFEQWAGDKLENILAYRDKCFPSVYTGTMGAPLPKTWVECKDDTLESCGNQINGVKHITNGN